MGPRHRRLYLEFTKMLGRVLSRHHFPDVALLRGSFSAEMADGLLLASSGRTREAAGFTLRVPP
jgi:hypothetical protein